MKTAAEWASKIMWQSYWTPEIATALVARIQVDALKAAAKEAAGGCYANNLGGCGPECTDGCQSIIGLISPSTVSE